MSKKQEVFNYPREVQKCLWIPEELNEQLEKELAKCKKEFRQVNSMTDLIVWKLLQNFKERLE